jgi:hypothetical protein
LSKISPMRKIGFILFFIFTFLFSVSGQNAPVVVNYSFEPAVQHFNVPPGVNTITISISGAMGGGIWGGNGASFIGICNVTSPHVLSVVVGQRGYAAADTGIHSGGCGGGASWLYDSNSVLYNPNGTIGLLAVAAGGGGAASGYAHPPNPGWRYYPGLDAGVDLFTNAATADSNCGPGGSGGNGGGLLPDLIILGGCGTGWLSIGDGGACMSGMDEANHFSVASSNCFNTLRGGFGGGGGGTDLNEAGTHVTWGGGGGGYNGGGDGFGGGGGGSYLNGTLVGTATASNTGNGSVTISYIPPLTQVIDIYPNPNSGVFTINGIRQEQTVGIYNCLGQKIQTLPASNTFMQLDLSAYSKGTYLVVVRNTDGSKAWQGKVVKTQ